jgi:hypothetical protein
MAATREVALRQRLTLILALTAVVSLLAATIAFAHTDPIIDDGAIDNAKATHGHDQHQHGGQDGHIDVDNYGVELVSKLRLSHVVEGKIADVGVFGDYAYLAAWGGATCKQNGVHVVDISDPASPQEVNFIPSRANSYPGEGVQALAISTPAFTGDVLVTNSESCTDSGAVGGMNIYDVTDPTNHVPLAVGFGDDAGPGTIAHEIHSVFAWDTGDKAYAVMVDNEETVDVDIVDITDPRSPALIAEFDLNERYPQIIQDDLGSGSSFLHDMVVKQIGGAWIMLLSYWDGGYVTLDVTDPTNPRYLADNDFANPDPVAAAAGVGDVLPEGNAHQAEFSLDNDYIIAADEDFSPYAVSATDNAGEEFNATMGIAIEPGTTLAGDLVYVGRSCSAIAPAAAAGQLALIERGDCTFTSKVGNAQTAGYTGAVVFNSQAAIGGTCTGLVNMSVEGDIPAIFVGRDTGFGFLGLPYDEGACQDDDATTGAVPATLLGTVVNALTLASYFDGWGYVHLFANGTGKLAELDTYAIPEAHDPTYAFDHGDMSVHEVAMSGQRNDLGYISYYAGGLRVVKIASPEKKGKKATPQLLEVGAFIDDGGNNFWGVQVFERDGTEYVAASDRDYGLYIFRYTGSD